jgi:hypothetical protein
LGGPRQPGVPEDAEILGESAWGDRLDGLGSYSFFATPTWARVISEAGMGYQARALEFDIDGRQALLPLVWNRDALGNVVCRSGALGTYGGLIPLDHDGVEVSPDFGSAAARRLRDTSRFGMLVASPGPRRHHPFPAVFDRYEAFVVDLEGRHWDQILEGMRPKTRQYIRKAERDGVRIEPGESEADYQAYYRLLEASARRWGRAGPGKPWALFDAIRRRCDKASVRLWMASVGDEPAAGLLCFYGKGEVFAWSAALDERHVATRANYLLHARAIADAASRGFAVMNLGANEGLGGVRWFKEGLGAAPREYPAYLIAAPAYRAAFWAWRTYRSIRAALRPKEAARP